MEVARLVNSALGKVENVRSMIKEDKKLQVDLKNGLDSIKCDMAMLSAKVKKISEENNQDAKPEEWILQLQDLAYDIEDFIDQRDRDPGASAPVRLLHVAMVMDPRPEHIDRINHFKERTKAILTLQESPATPSHIQRSIGYDNPVAGTSAGSRSPPNCTAVADLLGIAEPKSELLELLSDANVHQKQLQVISIVGCSGSGKTSIARALYEDEDVIKQFPCRASVEAHGGSMSILHKILRQVRQGAGQTISYGQPAVHSGRPGDASSDDVRKLTTHLQQFLRDKRFLIIIDDVHLRKLWTDIQPAFPQNEKGSRVVITTSIQSVATFCSSGSYLYTMRGLGDTHSKDLFWKKLLPNREDRAPVLEDALKVLFDKCDGLPRALVRTAEYLSKHRLALTEEHCKDLGVALGNHLAGDDPAFQEMKRALLHCYDSLADHAQKTCMLSVSIFPKGHRINRKSLVRRWMAEGFVVGDVGFDEDKVVRDCLDKLADLGIVEPVLIGENSKIKRCQVHGVMLEFIVHRSVSWNFIVLIREGRVVRNRTTACAPRRLSVHGIDGRGRSEEEIDLSRIRSLTICNSNLLDLNSCKLLRVLDLEGCTSLDNAVLNVICGLLYLKYLSLRRTKVSVLPKNIRDLHCLETLDVRQTRVKILRMVVLMLPRLAHLFGQFELPDELEDAKRADKVKKFLSEESRLQTLSGFIIVKNRGFEQIVLHAKMLRKVKIWCQVPPTYTQATPRPSNKNAGISKFIKKLFKKKATIVNLGDSLVSSLEKRFAGTWALDSLSIDFNGLCKNFLVSVLKYPSSLSSVKICGEMESLPASDTFSKLRNLTELHLSKTALCSDCLSGLQSLQCLVCLKLAEDREGFWDGTFRVQANGFPSLRQLCFHGPKLPKVQIEEGAMRSLRSLHVLCPEPAVELNVTGITHLEYLNEVILHRDAVEGKMEAWKGAAIRHKNRPYVKKQPNSDAL